MTSYNVPSPDELPKGQKIVLKGGDRYILQVKSITETMKDAYMDPTTKVLKHVFVFVAKSFWDNEALIDKDSKPVPPDQEVWLYYDLDLTKLGFLKSGQAALGRQLLLSLNGIDDMSAKVPGGNLEDLVGLTVIANVIVNPSTGKNKIIGFEPAVRRRGRAAAPAATVAPTATAPVTRTPVPESVMSAIEGGEPSLDTSALEDWFNDPST